MPLTFFEAAREAAREIPGFQLSAGVWVAALVLELRLGFLARRQARAWSVAEPHPDRTAPERRTEWLAAAGPFVYLATALLSATLARTRLLAGFRVHATPARVEAISDALGGMLNALPFAIEAALPLLLLAAYTVALQAWARHTALGLAPSRKRYIGAAIAVVALGFVPLGAGLASYCALLVKVAAGVAGVDPELKALMLTRGIGEARQVLDRTAVVGAGGLAATVLGVGAAWWRAAGRPVADDARRDRRARVQATTLFVAALALFGASVPLRAENRLAWPAPSPSAVLNVANVEPSTIVGPDPVPWAPVMFIEPKGLLLEGSPASPERAQRSLSILRQNFALLHPGEPFPGQLSVACAAAVPARALAQALAVAALSGYLAPSLIWARPDVVARPWLGAVPRPRFSAAAMEIPAGGQPGSIQIAPTETCGAFGARVAELRRKGARVRLDPFAAVPAR